MLVLFAALALQVPAQAPAIRTDSAARSDSAARADSVRRARRVRPVRRIPVTAEHERTAYADAAARAVVLRARSARLRQDSALVSYDAKVYQRMSAGMNFRAAGRERLFFRDESSARVRWHRRDGFVVDLTGARRVFPMGIDDEDEGVADGRDADPPIPYFPGKETLPLGLLGQGIVKAEVDENSFVHPLAEGAEAYYRYASGDSMTIVLPGNRRILLREVRATARRPDFRISVGSYWFDAGSGALVRAVMRMSAPLEVWKFVKEESARERAERDSLSRTDSARLAAAVAAAQAATDTSGARRGKEKKSIEEQTDEEEIPKAVTALMNPMRMELNTITTEYELREGRFWLPRSTSFEGLMQAMFIRIPVKFEQGFRYASVNGLDSLPRITRRDVPLSAKDSMALDSIMRKHYEPVLDSTKRVRTVNIGIGGAEVSSTERASYDSVRREYRARYFTRKSQCERDSTWVREVSRYDGALRYSMRVPCDTTVLSRSADLPPSIYDAGEELFDAKDREDLVKSLSFALQPLMGSPVPRAYWNPGLLRYNRVEGLSSAVGATMQPGRGWLLDGRVRLGIADLEPNAELSASRSNGRTTYSVGAFRRLAAANDRGNPLGLGSSISHFLYGRDEGFYYRTAGLELGGRHGQTGALSWRLFAEEHETAEKETDWSLAKAFAGNGFIDNIAAREGVVAGGQALLAFGKGVDPLGFRLAGDVRAEVGAGDFDYARTALDLTLSRQFTAKYGAALTGSGGWSGGTLPAQRRWYLGGAHTVRGQVAGTMAGDAYWLGRAELARGILAARTAIYGDVGWAGPRARMFDDPGRLMSGVGIGGSFLDGLVRVDLTRGLRPVQQWRMDLYVEARF